jgi:TolB-like protein/class 3 adenylate cyclase/Tfp pilus assembly protein PilF
VSEQDISPVEGKTDLALEIAHILFIDTVGYSKLSLGEQRKFQELLNQIVRGTSCFHTAEAAGKLIRLPTGDGMALVFAESIEAPLRCALEISERLRAHPELGIRMGIHSGSVSRLMDVNDRVNIAGAGVNIAQRVMSCGDAGHILMSKHVAEDLAEYPQWRPFLHDLGECEMKHGQKIDVVSFYSDKAGNAEVPRRLQQVRDERAVERNAVLKRRLAAAVLLVLLAAAAAVFFYRRLVIQPVEPGVPEKSIAVLPFENLSEDKANAYFADGIQDEILTRLSKIADLKVISRTSTEHYKSAPQNLTEIAKQLGVANILEGSVQKNGDKVRVNVQLIKATNDSHLWAETFDRNLIDVFSVESDIAKAIADQLRAHLTGREQQDIAAKSTDNPKAYDAYLRGLAFTLKAGTTPATTLGAQKYLREAVRLDPKFALSWALLSYVDALSYLSFNLEPTATLREETRQAAETALALQPTLGEALLAKGYYHYACLKDYDTAIYYFEQARQFLPNSSRISESLAYVARRRGQWDQSGSYFDEAEQLDPRNVNLLTQHALFYVELRRFPEALRKLDQVLNMTPDDDDVLALKGAIAQAEGDLPLAASILAPIRPVARDSSALETQVYQAILERRPAQIIGRLKQILTSPDPTLGYINGELRFWLGWAEQIGGDDADARETWRQARRELEPFLTEQPANYLLIADLTLTDMALGDKRSALSLAERAAAAVPLDKDPLLGPSAIELLARVEAHFGDRDRAIPALQKLLSLPYDGALISGIPITHALLRLDPMFDPLQGDRRFQDLTVDERREADNSPQ